MSRESQTKMESIMNLIQEGSSTEAPTAIFMITAIATGAKSMRLEVDMQTDEEATRAEKDSAGDIFNLLRLISKVYASNFDYQIDILEDDQQNYILKFTKK